MEATRQLRQICGDVGIELVGEHFVRYGGNCDQEHAEDACVDQGQAGTQREDHVGASVSMYPTPRTV